MKKSLLLPILLTALIGACSKEPTAALPAPATPPSLATPAPPPRQAIPKMHP